MAAKDRRPASRMGRPKALTPESAIGRVLVRGDLRVRSGWFRMEVAIGHPNAGSHDTS